MFEKKYYTRKQRKLYGLGWFAISFILVIVFVALDWTVLGYIASAFAIMSLYTGFFTKNEPPRDGEFTPEDFDNPKDHAESIHRWLKSMKKTLLDIKKRNKGKLTKKDIVSFIEELRPTYNDFDDDPKRGKDISFKISPDLEPFQFQVFFHELPEFQIEIYSAQGGKYEGFNVGILSDEKNMRVNIITDWLREKSTPLTKKLNKILLSYPNCVDDALIEKPWKSK